VLRRGEGHSCAPFVREGQVYFVSHTRMITPFFLPVPIS